MFEQAGEGNTDWKGQRSLYLGTLVGVFHRWPMWIWRTQMWGLVLMLGGMITTANHLMETVWEGLREGRAMDRSLDRWGAQQAGLGTREIRETCRQWVFKWCKWQNYFFACLGTFFSLLETLLSCSPYTNCPLTILSQPQVAHFTSVSSFGSL